jgi:choline dehydrogenase
MEQPSLKALIKKVTAPEEMDWRDTKALEAFVRQNIKTVYHPTGTCRLGQDRASSVTGLDLRVHGVPNLRVVDLSVCPMVTSGNTNATAIMIGERGAAQIVGRPLAAPEPEPVRAPAPWLKQV